MDRNTALDAYIVLTKLIISKNLPITSQNSKGLNSSQLFVLVKLYEMNEDCSISYIAHGCLIKKTSMTAIIDKLESLDYVHRKSDPHDRRSQLLHLTDAGKAYIEEYYNTVHEQLKSSFDHLTDEDVSNLGNASLYIAEVLANMDYSYGRTYLDDLSAVKNLNNE